MLSQRVRIAVITYLITCFILIQYPPKSISSTAHHYFGIGKQKTILPFWLILLLVAFVSYFVSLFF